VSVHHHDTSKSWDGKQSEAATALTAERVAAALFLDTETVRELRRLYQAVGVTGAERLHYEGSEAALTPEQLKALGAELDAGLYVRL
jgi:hypothetical protein